MKKILLCTFIAFLVSFNCAHAEKEKADLNFSEEQKIEIEKIKKESREKIEPLQEQIKKLRQEIEKIKDETRSSIRKTLTPEQQKVFDKKSEKRKDKKEEMKKRLSDKKDSKDKKDFKDGKSSMDKKDGKEGKKKKKDKE